MAAAIVNLLRLARAGVVMAQYGVRFVPRGVAVPLPLRLAYLATWPLRVISAPFRIGQPAETRVARALARLGPSYVKLGQFMATRADVIGPELAADLRHLQDRQEAFAEAEARRAIIEALGGRFEDHYSALGPAIAAASIAQVHKATIVENGRSRHVAVKVLRPGIERRFRRDLDAYFFAARQIERFHPPSRRLRPVAVVDNLARTTELEMDLRLEGAAISEMADNIAAGRIEGFRVPGVDWRRTQKRVLTLEWIDGIAISDHAALREAGFDLRNLGLVVLRTFLRHAMHDGFFHADMHQGNLLVERSSGMIVAVDFGIMGRLGMKERRFLAEILHGIITRDYRRAAEVHFWAGYVPPHHSIETFAQALRAIGEPIHGRAANEISMADLLGQLFAYTQVFDMQTRPELILLQKTMVVVEGVARSLDPTLDIWTAAEPIARLWMEENLGLPGQIKAAGEGAGTIGKLLPEVPALLQQAERTAVALGDMARDGVRLDQATVERIAEANGRRSLHGGLAIWIGALALVAFAVLQFVRG